MVWFGVNSTKPSRFLVLISSNLNVTCLFYCSPFSLCSSQSPCSRNCPDLLLLHCLQPWTLKIFPSISTFPVLFCTCSLHCHHTTTFLPFFLSVMRIQSYSTLSESSSWFSCRFFIFSAKWFGPNSCFWVVKVNCNHFQSGLKENGQTQSCKFELAKSCQRLLRELTFEIVVQPWVPICAYTRQNCGRGCWPACACCNLGKWCWTGLWLVFQSQGSVLAGSWGGWEIWGSRGVV